MTNKEIKSFLKKIKNLNLSRTSKERMLRLIQIKYNKRNKVMTYNSLKSFLKNNNCMIDSMILGPKWNSVIFIELKEKQNVR